MFKIVAFTHNASESDTEIANKCLSTLEYEYQLYNIPQFRVESHIEKDTIVITFGQVAQTQVQQYLETKKINGVRVIALPSLKKLINQSTNTKYRQQALQELQTLKKLLDEDIFYPVEIIIRKSDLPDLDSKHLLMLSKITENNKRNSCFQTNKDGKLIEISNTKQKESKADLHITFDEIYTIKLVMDLLGVSEVSMINQERSKTNESK